MNSSLPTFYGLVSQLSIYRVPQQVCMGEIIVKIPHTAKLKIEIEDLNSSHVNLYENGSLCGNDDF